MRTFNSGMSVASVVQAGGEVTKFDSDDNAMGVSGFHDMEYKRASNGIWYSWSAWHITHVDTSDGYTLVQLGSIDEFQNYGNNP